MTRTAEVTLRAETPADQAFLYRLFTSTRAGELEALGRAGLDTQAFLQSQFGTQQEAYRRAHPTASFDLVLLDGEPAGRLYVDRTRDRTHVIDVSLIPEHRGSGVGTRLLNDLLEEARVTDRLVTLDCIRGNPALALYDRLGFRRVASDDAYLHLAWSPGHEGSGQANTAS